jgi:hypothetical protein
MTMDEYLEEERRSNMITGGGSVLSPHQPTMAFFTIADSDS